MKIEIVIFVAVFGVVLSAEFHAKKIVKAALDNVEKRAKRSAMTYGGTSDIVFRVADTNNDGQVSLTELIGFVERELPGTYVVGSLKRGFEILFDQEDKNKNGYLDENEFGHLVQRAQRYSSNRFYYNMYK